VPFCVDIDRIDFPASPGTGKVIIQCYAPHHDLPRRQQRFLTKTTDELRIGLVKRRAPLDRGRCRMNIHVMIRDAEGELVRAGLDLRVEVNFVDLCRRQKRPRMLERPAGSDVDKNERRVQADRLRFTKTRLSPVRDSTC